MADLGDTLSSLVSKTNGEATVVFLENAAREIEVGIHDFEFGSSQRVIFDIYAAHISEGDAKLLGIEDVMDYEYLIEALDHVIGSGRFELLEQIANELLDIILSPVQVIAGIVKITKSEIPGVQGALGCCITRIKE